MPNLSSVEWFTTRSFYKLKSFYIANQTIWIPRRSLIMERNWTMSFVEMIFLCHGKIFNNAGSYRQFTCAIIWMFYKLRSQRSFKTCSVDCNEEIRNKEKTKEDIFGASVTDLWKLKDKTSLLLQWPSLWTNLMVLIERFDNITCKNVFKLGINWYFLLCQHHQFIVSLKKDYTIVEWKISDLGYQPWG